MKLSTLLRHELKKRNIRTIRAAAAVFGISAETTRCLLNRDRIPKDRILVKIANTLQLDPAEILIAAQRQRLPRDLRDMILPRGSVDPCDLPKKRKWPLSQEQCDYLDREMLPHEIQLIRKYRQLTLEERGHVRAYLEYIFAEQRVFPLQPVPSPQEPLAVAAAQTENTDDRNIAAVQR